MTNHFRVGTRILAPLLVMGACFAQSPDAYKYYKLDFLVKEVDAGKVLNSRAYSMIVAADKTAPRSSLRSGSKIPVPSSKDPAQFNYVEVGVNIDIRQVQEIGNNLSLSIVVEISGSTPEPGSTPPVIRQNRWDSSVEVPLRKATILFSSDDPASKRQIQLELTANPLK